MPRAALQVDVIKKAYLQEEECENAEVSPREVGHNIYILALQVGSCESRDVPGCAHRLHIFLHICAHFPPHLYAFSSTFVSIFLHICAHFSPYFCTFPPARLASLGSQMCL